MSERAVPVRVPAAERLAAEAGFRMSCTAEVGRLLRTAAAAKPGGVVAESGTGRVSVLTGDWRLLERHAPFDVFFCDGGGKRDDPGRVVELLSPGGILVLDDFTPSAEWPPRFEGEVDELRLFHLTHPDLDATEVLTTPTTSAVVAARRGAPR
ncbi:transferase [Streptomyces luteogriseus]|uniref:transferase n=1 Tax=Streptomyces luteogriseus TaxID=68233 RepID=UPI0037A59BEB